PPELQAVEMSYLAKSYIAAAELLQAAPQHWLPMLQLTGQAVELALKAYLAASKVAPPNGHDLLDLYRRAQAHGVTLEGPMFAALEHLQHFYFEDLVTRTRYKSRYPARK